MADMVLDRNRRGAVLVYPVAQFDDERVVDGLGEVLDILVPDDTEA